MRLQGWLIMLTGMTMFLALLGINVGLNALFDGIGIEIDEDTATLVKADIEDSTFWSRIFGANGILIILGAGAVVTIGLLARGYDPSLIIIPFIVFVAGLFIPTFWAIIQLTIKLHQPWMTSIIGVIFVSLSIGFTTACVDYFAGR